MRIAAIDIGTNSLHMIVVRIRPDLSFEVIDREKEMVRLGAGGLDGRALTAEAMHAALQVLSKFRRLADSHRVDEIIAVATSATAPRVKPKTAANSSRPSSRRRGFEPGSFPAPKKPA
jgi:exopolyphosphatase/guanosine-5'-triphosphate,3'-diphosphate pyrophosphatase